MNLTSADHGITLVTGECRHLRLLIEVLLEVVPILPELNIIHSRRLEAESLIQTSHQCFGPTEACEYFTHPANRLS